MQSPQGVTVTQFARTAIMDAAEPLPEDLEEDGGLIPAWLLALLVTFRLLAFFRPAGSLFLHIQTLTQKGGWAGRFGLNLRPAPGWRLSCRQTSRRRSGRSGASPSGGPGDGGQSRGGSVGPLDHLIGCGHRRGSWPACRRREARKGRNPPSFSYTLYSGLLLLLGCRSAIHGAACYAEKATERHTEP